ncbi:MAG: GTP cyclohydrolase I FolE [Spirochaetes bacterium]|nr:GTP cyclohydrolase I FolE [Spirochaetota bacterium]
MDKEKIKKAVRMIIEEIDPDPDRPDIVKTPERVARMYEDIFSGGFQNPEDTLQVLLMEQHNEIVIVKDIPIFSMCEHHMLPFTGVAHIAYIPGEKVIGLSKIPRIVDMYANRLQIQERLTNQVADALVEVLDAKGVAVIFEGVHMCASIRGVKKHNLNMKTTAFRGEFINNRDLKAEFYDMINRK